MDAIGRLDETPAAATQTIRAYQQLLAGQIEPSELLGQVQALEKLGVTEGTLARPGSFPPWTAGSLL